MASVTSQAPRLVLSLLAAVTLALTAGGALGVWPTGTPASALHAASQSPVRSAGAPVPSRDMEGANGHVSGDTAGGERNGSTSRQPADAPGDDADGEAAEQTDESPQEDAGAGEAGEGTGAQRGFGDEVAVPSKSGQGRRVVFDISEQRVWLVGGQGRVHRTYLVSGSKTDNLGPGRYEVYSRSRHAVSYTYEETMRFMVRFAHGETAAIGFHDIPRDQKGHRVQTREELGTPLSSGCIRQARPDAVALWKFADVGTDIVVVD